MRRSRQSPSLVVPSAVILSAAALAAAALLVPVVAAPAPSRPVTAVQALDRLKGLAGTWEGNIEGEMGGKARIEYRVISGGSVVLETLFPGSAHEMVSVYSVEAGELRMVHYCALGNQPRFRLDRGASSADELRFVLDGGTGFDPKTDEHIHGGRIVLRGADSIESAWEYYKGGASQGQHAVILARVAAPAGTEVR